MLEGSDDLIVTPTSNGWTIEGELDAHTAVQLAELVGAVDGADDLVLDVGGVSFVDSSGIRTLLRMADQAREAGSRLIVTHPTPAFLRTLEISGLIGHLIIE